MDELFKYLAAGGDLGIFALAIVLWKLDRRLLLVETALKHLPKRREDSGG